MAAPILADAYASMDIKFLSSAQPEPLLKLNTPLYHAVKGGFNKKVQEFLDDGLPAEVINSALLVAYMYARTTIVRVLSKRGAHVGILD